ncbi:MAG: hypothetical protein EGP09_05400 [SAR202 cluster bacterium]|nr:MAG: hypothetical protein EGP09_05400 [SAR202 cluster bacterium]
MDLSKIKEFIVQEKLLNKILNSPDEVYPLGTFKSSEEFPLGWTNNINKKLFVDYYEELNQFEKFVFIGLGGSINLAKIASFINPTKIYIIDSLDIKKIQNLSKIIQSEKCAIVVCSKSGTTVETNILRNILSYKNKDSVFYISDHYISDKDKEKTFITQKDIGGRFSLGTHFGILPFYLAGFSINDIVKNINLANKESKENNIDNKAITIASIIYKNYLLNKNILSINSISNDDFIADWLEQLIAESLGKEESGILPIIQNNKFSPNLNFSNDANKYDLDSINIKISYNESLFYEFQIFFYVISILGILLKIQPFDQPNVELTKSLTTKFLESNQSLELEEKYYSLSSFEKKFSENNDNDKEKIISMLIFSSQVDKELLDNLEKLKVFCFKSQIILLVYFAPTYLHSTGQLLKGSFKNIENFIVHLHGNEDQEIPNSLYTLNTFVKNQAISDYMALKKYDRNVQFIQTNKIELNKKVEAILR